MSNLNVAVIGASGFVGNAVSHGFIRTNLFRIDPRLGTSITDILDKDIHVAFICVPTPMGDSGQINASIVVEVLEQLSVMTNTLIVLKSTVTPDIVGQFAAKYDNFIYNPEFLTERNAVDDFIFPIMQVFGGSRTNTDKLEQIYNDASNCRSSRVFHMSAKEAAFVKYGINTFLATKVLFWNQFFDICQLSDVEYENIIQAIGYDPRINKSHTMVPGPDGRRGSAGPCFAKDVPALIRYSQKLDYDFSVLNNAWNANCDYRNSYDTPMDREIEQHITFKKI